jgi:hypothetical protein
MCRGTMSSMQAIDEFRSTQAGRRDGIALDPVRVKALREEGRLTQEDAGRAVHRLLNSNGSRTSERTQLVTYQRIERTGLTSRKYANALAQVLDTTVAVLQGDTPEQGPTLARRVEVQLRAQLAAGLSPALQARLKGMQGDGDHVQWLAEDLAVEIEEAQLPQRSGELARLSNLTGWSERALHDAGAVHGHWLVVSPLLRMSRITTGVDAALQIVKDECAEGVLRLAGSDVTIALTEELPWLRLEVSSPNWVGTRRPRLIFSLVRCMPTRRGLEWRNPTWRDRDLLDWHFPQWAFGHADYVTWKGKSFPEDVGQMRLLLERSVGPDEAEHVALLEGCLAEMPADHLEHARTLGRSHEQVTRCLRTGLWQVLAPHLAAWPLEHWRVQAWSTITLSFDIGKIPMRVHMRTRQRPPTFAIRLVEVAGKELRPAPWRLTSVESVAKLLTEQLERAKAEVAVGPPHPDPWPA